MNTSEPAAEKELSTVAEYNDFIELFIEQYHRKLNDINDVRLHDQYGRADLLLMGHQIAWHAFCGTPALWTGAKFIKFHTKFSWLFPGMNLFTKQFKEDIHYWDDYYEQLEIIPGSPVRMGTVVHLSWAYALGTALWIMKQLKCSPTVNLKVYCYELTTDELENGMWCKIELPTILRFLDQCGIARERLIIEMVLLNESDGVTHEQVESFVQTKLCGVGCVVV